MAKAMAQNVDLKHELSTRLAQSAGRADAGVYGLDVKIHDRTRIAWVATAPVADKGQPNQYSIEMCIDVPEHLWAKHKMWPAFRARSRLQSPDTRVYPFQMRSVLDEIRHEALRTIRSIKRIEQRALRADSSVESAKRFASSLRRELQNTRAALGRSAQSDDDGAQTEASLADEYISMMYLSSLARVREHWAEDDEILKKIHKLVRRERKYRFEYGWPTPQGKNRRELGRWLRRRGALKRHFHQLLWLDAYPFRPEDRLGNWIAAFVAVIASSWAFAWHIAYMNQLVSGGLSMVSMLLAGALAGVLYAIKDRIKDIGRRWIAHRVRDGIADKIVHLHLQERIDHKQSRLMSSREQLRATRVKRADPLNPALGETHKVVALSIHMRVDQNGSGVPSNWGVGGVKHVMRYDLSALFSRVDHGARQVPIAEEGGLFSSEAIRKRYELPVICRLTGGDKGVIKERSGRLLIDRRGLRELRLN
ncbi:MAG TPA: hypothetical protein DCQ06_02740 [Myxococcales bacterium]|nr:hypothetical protein [Myxococcales bacterium]